MTEKQFKTISIIANQERNHAAWVAELLHARNIIPKKLEKVERYWDKTLTTVDSFIRGAAVAAHAEEMRLERIRAICNDTNAPADIKMVFRKILPQEEFHARAFKKMTTSEEYDRTQHAHELGRVALGLEP
jgi:rubrerythrin